jgi:hypothetical protein
MVAALGQVLPEHVAGGCMQGHQAVLAKLGPADGQHRGVEVDICKLEVERLAQPQARDTQQSKQAVKLPRSECIALVAIGHALRRMQQAADLFIRVQIGTCPPGLERQQPRRRNLRHPNVNLLLEQVGGKTVPQGVHRDPLVQLGVGRGGMHGAVELPGAHRVNDVLTGEQPAAVEHLALGTGHAPPSAQPLEQHRREHGIAIPAPLALLDAQGHALAVDVTDLEAHHLARAQPGTVGHRQGRLVLEVTGPGDQAGDLIQAQYHRQGTGHPDRAQLLRQRGTVEGDLEEELEAGEGGVQHDR